VIAGDGEPGYTAHLRALAEGLPVRFLGVVPQPEFFKQVDVCVVPSLWAEPLSRVLFEAFAHGVPVIASATGGSAELVKPGETGWLFDIHQTNGLAERLQSAHSEAERYEAISRTALELAATFRPERVVSEYIDLYRTVQHRGKDL
jgi:glycosyltransferase involved in cell wall biosynthesis